MEFWPEEWSPKVECFLTDFDSFVFFIKYTFRHNLEIQCKNIKSPWMRVSIFKIDNSFFSCWDKIKKDVFSLHKKYINNSKHTQERGDPFLSHPVLFTFEGSQITKL